MDNDNRSAKDILDYVRLMRDRILRALKDKPYGRIELRNYFVVIDSSGHVDFWRKGQKTKSRITCGHRGSFVITDKTHRTVLTDFAGIKIEEYFEQPKCKTEYPKIQRYYHAYGESRNKLSFLRVDLSGSTFVNYYPYIGYVAASQGVTADPIPPAPPSCPATLMDATEIFGVPLKFEVDVDEWARNMIKESGFVEMAAEAGAFAY